MAALIKLKSTCYYQGRKVDDYIDEFLELIDEAGYTNGLSIVMKFRRGLDRDIQDWIAELVQGRPEDDDLEGWYSAACMFNANWTANQAFHGTQHAMVPSLNVQPTFPTLRTTFLVQPMTPMPTPCTSQYPRVPVHASNVPTPMDINATRRQNAILMLCRCCGEPGHFVRECPKAYDVRYMFSDEREDWIECLLGSVSIPTDSGDSGDSIEAVRRYRRGFYIPQQVNCTPPLSTSNHYALLDVDLVEENSTLPSKPTDEATIVADVQLTPQAPSHPVYPPYLKRWERRLPCRYVVASTLSENSLHLKVEIVTMDTQQLISFMALLDCGATSLFVD
jgi:hypothetical protein